MKLYRYGKIIETLGQRYRLDGSLGSGGMADICLAWDQKNQREVAIKILKTHQLDPAMLNRFIREGSLIRSWQHPHIIQIYDDVRMELLDPKTGSTIPYLIMEYLSGGTLEDRLNTNQPYPFPKTLLLFEQLCDALQYAHEHGVIHRDLKPSNILFKNSSEAPDHSVLSDFGLAVSMVATHHTFSHGGTPLYMAPEQLRGQTIQASDLFALGIILYRLCTGQMPFQLFDLYKTPLPIPTSPSNINTALPKALDSVILSTLSEDPQQRPANAWFLWQHLQSAATTSTRARQKSLAIKLPPKPIQRPLTQETGQNENILPPSPQSPANHLTQPDTSENAALDDLAIPQPPSNQENGGATQAINPDNDDSAFQLPPVEPIDPTTSSLTIGSEPNVSTPIFAKRTASEQENNEASDAAEPDIIDLQPRKRPRNTLPLPDRSTRRVNNAADIPGTGETSSGTVRVSTTSNGWVMRTPVIPPTPPPSAPTITRRNAPRRSRRAPRLLVPLLLIITALLVCTSIALAYPAAFKTFMPKSSVLPGNTSPTISIIPANQIVSNTYIITGVTGTPDPKQQTIKARSLSSTTQSAALPVTASGHQQTTGVAAKGTLTFFNSAFQAMRIAPTTFHVNSLAFTMDSSVVIPAFDGVNIAKATVTATADAVGTAGNIGPLVINQTCCVSGVSVRNNTAFTGGVDPANYNFVKQADVDAVATQAVQSQVAQKAANQIKSQLVAGEVLAEQPQCTTSTNSSNPVGDTGQNVDRTSVTVTANCSSVSYDNQGMRSLVTNLLTQKAQISPGIGYVLQDNRIIISPTVESTNPVSLNVSAKGQWVYQFGPQQQQDLLNLIKGKTVAAAKTALLSAKGVANATIQFSGTTLPTDLGQMIFTTEMPAPLSEP